MVLLKNKQAVKSTPGGKPDISVIEAGLDSLSKEVVELKKDIKDQRNENKNVIVGVLIAFLLIVITVATEVILFHSNSDKNLLDVEVRYSQNIRDLREKNLQDNFMLQKEIDLLKEKLDLPPQ